MVLWVVTNAYISAFQPPVDVYSTPTPSSHTGARVRPASLLPVSVAGMTRTVLETNRDEDAMDAVGTYQGAIRIKISRFDSHWDARDRMKHRTNAIFNNDQCYYLTAPFLVVANFYETGGFRVRSYNRDWFIKTESGQSMFVWRKGEWVFEVYAPTESLRDEAVQGLRF